MLYMLLALNSGAAGMTSVHANSAREALRKLTTLPLLTGDRIPGRAEPVFDRKRGTLDLLGSWGDTGRLDEALDDLADFLGATRVVPPR